MANVLHKTTLEYRESVNTPDYPTVDWIHSPDMSGVVGVPHKYWKLVGDAPVEMTQPEKDVVDADLLEAERNDLAAGYDERDLAAAVIRLMQKEINILRALHSLSERTDEQIKAALKAEIS